MIGDTSFINVFEEQCVIVYYSERSSITWKDTEEMIPYEREISISMFKKFDEQIKENEKKAEKKNSGFKGAFDETPNIGQTGNRVNIN
jgi:hypothetical protein